MDNRSPLTQNQEKIRKAFRSQRENIMSSSSHALIIESLLNKKINQIKSNFAAKNEKA